MNASRLTLHVNSWGPPLFWALAILAVSGDWGSSHNTLGLVHWLFSRIADLSAGQIEALHNSLRKLGHMLAYGVLCFLCFRSFQLHRPERRGFCLFLAVFCSLAVALLDEGHQAMVGSRRGSVLDVGWDMAGAGLAGGFILARWKAPGSGG